jgi:biopolymer transport protein ExbD
MLFSLAIPFVHISLNVTDTNKYELPFNEIGKFRSYYEQLIAMTDPEFLTTQENSNNLDFEEFDYNYKSNSINNKNINTKISTIDTQQELHETKKSKITIAQVLFVLYLIGAIIFLTRIVLLFKWVYKTISNNIVRSKNKIKLVEVNDNLPPFSFLSYVFLNKDILNNNNKADQILAHEEIHVKQKHSVDLLLAHFLTIFHWFNPLAWLLQKAIKTNHEYLADSEVVNKGYDLLDYQVLLLNQFISIPSVELVNNFNLISIKNRITMMNKIKSGFTAKLKAFLIIPFALIAFLLFANLTVTGPGKVLKNFSFFENQNNIEQLQGLWKNDSKDAYGQLIKFDDNKFSVLESLAMLKEYQYKIKDNYIVLDFTNGEPIKLRFQITNNKIKIWWNDLNISEYTKTEYKNSLDIFLADKGLKITPPAIKNNKLLQRQELCLFVGIEDNKVVVQDQVGKFDDLEKLIIKERSKFNQLDLKNVTIQLAVDENTPMKKVYDLQQILRKNNLLKIAHVGYCEDKSSILSQYNGFTHILPPMEGEGFEILNKEDLPAMGINFFEIDATDNENSSVTIEPKLTKFISESEKYMMALLYNNSTTYKDYINYMDMVWTVVLNFRNKYALEKYNVEYENLEKELQKEVKKKYPIILSQLNIDEDEYEK